MAPASWHAANLIDPLPSILQEGPGLASRARTLWKACPASLQASQYARPQLQRSPLLDPTPKL